MIEFVQQLKRVSQVEVRRCEKRIIDEKKRQNLNQMLEKEKLSDLEKKQRILVKSVQRYPARPNHFRSYLRKNKKGQEELGKQE